MMHWRFRSRSMTIAGLCLMLTLATSALIERAHAQAMQLTGFNALDPQWAFAGSHMSSGFNAGFNTADGINQPAYTTRFGSGTFGLFAGSTDAGAGGLATSASLFDPLASAAPYRQDWFAGVGNPAWSKSVFGSYKSDPNAALSGLYTTASFGVTSFTTNPAGLPGLSNFSAGNEAVGMTARAGLGLQLTPQISIEGSIGVTQISGSGFR